MSEGSNLKRYFEGVRALKDGIVCGFHAECNPGLRSVEAVVRGRPFDRRFAFRRVCDIEGEIPGERRERKERKSSEARSVATIILEVCSQDREELPAHPLAFSLGKQTKYVERNFLDITRTLCCL